MQHELNWDDTWDDTWDDYPTHVEYYFKFKLICYHFQNIISSNRL